MVDDVLIFFFFLSDMPPSTIIIDNYRFTLDTLLPPPPKVKVICFHPCLFVCLFVCVSVCEQDISKSYGRIQPKLSGQVGCLTRTN